MNFVVILWFFFVLLKKWYKIYTAILGRKKMANECIQRIHWWVRGPWYFSCSQHAGPGAIFCILWRLLLTYFRVFPSATWVFASPWRLFKSCWTNVSSSAFACSAAHDPSWLVVKGVTTATRSSCEALERQVFETVVWAARLTEPHGGSRRIEFVSFLPLSPIFPYTFFCCNLPWSREDR